MIPVQKHFPPELIRKALRDPKRLEEAGWNVSDLERACRQAEFDRWKLAQQRQSWLYAAVGGAVLCVVIFVVAGGCK